jgi:hypothetical protein
MPTPPLSFDDFHLKFNTNFSSVPCALYLYAIVFSLFKFFILIFYNIIREKN